MLSIVGGGVRIPPGLEGQAGAAGRRDLYGPDATGRSEIQPREARGVGGLWRRLGIRPKELPETPGGEDTDGSLCPHLGQIAVAGHEDIRFAEDRLFDDALVVCVPYLDIEQGRLADQRRLLAKKLQRLLGQGISGPELLPEGAAELGQDLFAQNEFVLCDDQREDVSADAAGSANAEARMFVSRKTLTTRRGRRPRRSGIPGPPRRA